jgi:hypothetical protein
VQCAMSVQHHDDTTIAYCHRHGILYQAYGVMKGCSFADSAVVAAAAHHKVTAAQVCIQWTLQRGVAMALGVGPEHDKADDAEHFSLNSTELAAINAVAASSGGFAGVSFYFPLYLLGAAGLCLCCCLCCSEEEARAARARRSRAKLRPDTGADNDDAEESRPLRNSPKKAKAQLNLQKAKRGDDRRPAGQGQVPVPGRRERGEAEAGAVAGATGGAEDEHEAGHGQDDDEDEDEDEEEEEEV